MTIRAALKRLVPPPVFNWAMLHMTFLQRLPFVRYESNLEGSGGLEDLEELVEMALPLEGDIIECGSSRCGTSILMADLVRSRGSNKRVYACDSFRGYRPEELERERWLGLTRARFSSFASTSHGYVVEKIRRLGFEGRVVPIEGFFQETLPRLSPQQRFCFALIDCDLELSAGYCAETLWPCLVEGGVLAFDDYRSREFKGVRLAVDAFVSEKRSEIGEHGLLRRLYYLRKASTGRRSRP